MAKKPSLLCVDDDAQSLAVRKIMFEAFGFRVTTTIDPRQGLRMHAAQRYDAAILDFQMPHMDGGELAKAMKMARPNVPVVILSGLPDLPAETPQYYDRFYCKTESGFKLAQEIQNLIVISSPPGGGGGQVNFSKRLFAAAGIAVGFATQGMSDVREKVFGKGMPVKSVPAVPL
jgi:CheY-like chemotaxis protein